MSAETRPAGAGLERTLDRDYYFSQDIYAPGAGADLLSRVGLRTPDAAAERDYPLARQLAGVPERLCRYPLDQLRCAKQIVYEVRVNWKVMLENYNQCYHCGPVHSELCRLVPAFRQRGGADLDWERGIPHREGAWTFTQSGTSTRSPFGGLNEDERVRHKGDLIYPNLLLSLSAEHVASFTVWPRGPEHTSIVCEFLFHPADRQTRL